MDNIKNNRYTLALAISVIAIVAIVFYGIFHKTEPVTAEELQSQEEEVYKLNERTMAEFQPVIIEKFNEESELVVYSVETTAAVDLKQAGLFDWSILNKTQTLNYKGNGVFYVDLSSLGEKNLRLDNAKKTIIIEIPHTKMASVEIDPEQFEADETRKGFLAFGEMKFTAKEYNDLEKEVRNEIYHAVHTDSNFKKADELAVTEMKKIYEPVVKMIDDDYTVEITFIR